LFVWVGIGQFTRRKIIILSISTALFFTAISIQNRFEGISIISRIYDISDDGFSYITLRTRIDTYAAAWEVIKKKPIAGVGLGPDVGETETGYVVHNILLLSWFESGLFGFLGILMILASITMEAYKGLRNPKHKKIRILGIALFSSYIAFLILGMFQPIYYKRYGWLSASLLLALYSKRNRSVGQHREIRLTSGNHETNGRLLN
jgi:O-antigen ligase